MASVSSDESQSGRGSGFGAPKWRTEDPPGQREAPAMKVATM
jgi:hypothetical protein